MRDETTIECDKCGRAFTGWNLVNLVRRYADGIVCVYCRPLPRTVDETHRVTSPAAALAFGSTNEDSLRVA